MATTSPPTTRAVPSPHASPSTSPSKSPRGSNSKPDPTPSPSTSKPTSASASAPPAPKPRARPTLRILCYGDSLTSGYTSGPDHPYSLTLLRVLSQAFPSLSITADTDGAPGDVVCTPGSRFLSRIEPKFLTRAGGTPYDWTLVLGGTNDLALGSGADQIFEALRRVWGVPLSRGGRVLACTVPEAAAGPNVRQAGGTAGGDVFERVDRKRNALNELIRNHKQEGFHVFDLQAAMPHHSLSAVERARYWDDGVHLTPEGYDLMGEKIAAALVELIMPPGRLQPTANGSKRRRLMRFRDDEKRFEEESGDEKALPSGWIVVRRKDLD